RHDDPNDPARAAGKGPKAWWDNSSCRNPDFHLPDLGRLDVSPAQLQDRTGLLRRLEGLRRRLDNADRAGLLAGWDAHRQRALQLLTTTRRGRNNPFDLAQEPARIRDLYGREGRGQGVLAAPRPGAGGVRLV